MPSADYEFFRQAERFPSPSCLRVAEMLAALSQALDLGSGSTEWHSVRTCILGMRLADELGVPESIQAALYYDLLLKDDGCAVRASLGLHAEHHRGRETPPALGIVLLAQTLDIYSTALGPEAALRFIKQKTHKWLNPDLVKAAASLSRRAKLWAGLADQNPIHLAMSLEPRPTAASENHVTFDEICQAFGAVVDAKSSFTQNHSSSVARIVVRLAQCLDLDSSSVLLVKRAALLHDLGKMAVSDKILQKAGELDSAEWRIMRLHPAHTWRILRHIRGFEEVAEVAGSHHERLDGSGYFRGLTAAHLSIESRILMVADVFDALSTRRPYRDALPLDKVLAIIRKGSPHSFDPTCVEALEQSSAAFPSAIQ